MKRVAVWGLTALLAFAITAPTVSANGEVNVYSYRQPFLIKPMFAAFTRDTGIAVNTVFAKKGLSERLRQEGKNSPADLIFTVDIARLTDVHEQGLTQKIDSSVLKANIPAAYHGPQSHWVGLTSRARIIVASKALDLKSITYEALADPEHKGRLCTRSGKHPYMVALVAAMISHHGEEAAENWLRGVKANLARKPTGNDRAQVKAISEGECEIAVINHYYLGKMLASEEQSAWVDAVDIIFPNQSDRGTHVNVSGVALAKYAPNRANAIKLIEFLSGDLAQQMYAEQNAEYPLKAGVPWSGLLQSFGTFKTDSLALQDIAAKRNAASKLVDRVNYDG
ncbi:MAG: Fe(3+) ABC transporter substrate-binding protein [Gammaproteobacteria bacterium]|nr:Fe(3+) ABC transporter substrate-binding protein [Gammaproteobacteria bacterium]